MLEAPQLLVTKWLEQVGRKLRWQPGKSEEGKAGFRGSMLKGSALTIFSLTHRTVEGEGGRKKAPNLSLSPQSNNLNESVENTEKHQFNTEEFSNM